MKMDNQTRARARRAISQAARLFLYDPNVNLIDFGFPLTGNALNPNDIALRIHVRRKLSSVSLETAAGRGLTRPIPKYIAGFKTDVPEGIYQPHWRYAAPPTAIRTKTRSRTAHHAILQGGISISDAYRNTYGTLGGFVVDAQTGTPMLLSNWHIIVGQWRARKGQPIYQPGRANGGNSRDTVAVYERDAILAGLDAAVARLTGSRGITHAQFGLGMVRGIGIPELGMPVVKSGCGSGATRGRITAVDGIARLPYNGVTKTIRNIVTIEQPDGAGEVSRGGDSGSWWLEESTMKVVGLHFAGSDMPERALANDIVSVARRLQIKIVV